MVDRLNRALVDDARIGSQHNQQQMEDIITEKRWPKVLCKVCGETHLAAIRKVMETKQGGEFEFVEPECPNRPAGDNPAEE
jgi:hypothetical protein